MKNKKFFLFFLLVLFFLNLFNKYDTYYQDIENINVNFFVNGHILGTDELGRDMLARLISGTINTFLISLGVIITVSLIGVLLGYLMSINKRLDSLFIFIIQLVISIPSLIISICILVFLGNSMLLLIISLSIGRSLRMALIMRNEIKKISLQNYVLISKNMGASYIHILKKHILPNILSILILRLSFMIPGIIFSETFLSFMGIGVRLPRATLGNILTSGFRNLLINPIQFILVSLCIISITMIFGGIDEDT